MDGHRAAPMFIIALAAVLLSAVPNVGAADQRPIMVGNGSLCSGINGDVGLEGGGCLTIGDSQPELEGFEMAMDLGSGVVAHRSLLDYGPLTGNSGNPSANCGRDRRDKRYASCTTDARSGSGSRQQCGQYNRNNPCLS